MEIETGLSLLGRLTERPALDHLFGAGQGAPPGQLTAVLTCRAPLNDGGRLTAAFCCDIICNVVLPPAHKGVELGGCGASLVLINCNHHLTVMEVAEELQSRMRKTAEDHYRSLPNDKRKTDRLTSTDQWHIVKQSLERLLVMEVYDPDSLETSLVSLKNILMANSGISCILVDSINTFYQQVRGETGLYHSAYLRRLLAHLGTACRDVSTRLRVLYTQIQFFEDTNSGCGNVDNHQDRVILEPVPHSSSYRVRCGPLELEWPFK